MDKNHTNGSENSTKTQLFLGNGSRLFMHHMREIENKVLKEAETAKPDWQFFRLAAYATDLEPQELQDIIVLMTGTAAEKDRD